MNTRSLGFRLVMWYAGLLTVVFVVLGALTLIYLRYYLEANLLDTQMRRARQIADTLLASATPATEHTIASQIEDLYSPTANERFIRITRGDGRILYSSASPTDKAFDAAQIPPLRPDGTVQSRRKEYGAGGALLVATLRYPDRGRMHGGEGPRYFVEVGASTARTEFTLRRVMVMLTVGLPITVSIAVGGGFALVRRALTPVARIARTAEEITQHNLNQRLPSLKTGDELERLSISLNHMIERLQETIQSSKRFVADASHELRTPLTVLRGELESLAQDTRLEDSVRDRLGSMLEEVDRLAEIVEALLALSRLDAGEGRDEWARFNLADLVSTTADQMALLAEDKGVRVICTDLRDVTVQGNQARLKQVIVNLLDNAIKYTPKGGSVRLRVTDEAGCGVLEFTDQGVGIPAEALPHVFERFYRVDHSRSREQGGGVGLGLSIVKSICAAHDASIEVTSVWGKGSTFRVTFPRAQPGSTATAGVFQEATAIS